MWAVVPAKEIAQAKQRLAPRLSLEERRDFVLAMLGDVLEVLSSVAALEGRVVVTRDSQAATLARGMGAEVLEERSGGGLNDALRQAAEHLGRIGARGILVVPADLPSLTAEEVSAVLGYHAGVDRAMTLVSDRHGRGTNCFACSPPDLCEFHFGNDSFRAHLEAGRRVGIVARCLELVGVQMDVDTPEDLDVLRDSLVGRRTRILLSRLRATAEGAAEHAVERRP
jgi:2-phospho-L-lactate guanylyltransferase